VPDGAEPGAFEHSRGPEHGRAWRGVFIVIDRVIVEPVPEAQG
jgi:hypothetical protein